MLRTTPLPESTPTQNKAVPHAPRVEKNKFFLVFRDPPCRQSAFSLHQAQSSTNRSRILQKGRKRERQEFTSLATTVPEDTEPGFTLLSFTNPTPPSMTSRQTTYRTLAEDEEAPPPYDPIAPSTMPQTTTTHTSPYPAIDTSRRQVPESTSEPPPPSIDYYPAMTVPPPRPSPIATSVSPYHQYPVYSPIATTAPTTRGFQPPYPVFNPHVPGSVQGMAYPVMSNPGSTRVYPTMEQGLHQKPQQPFQPTAPTPPVGSWGHPLPTSPSTWANDPKNPFNDESAIERDLISLDDPTPVHKTSFISDDLSPPLALASPALATPSVPPVPPTPSEPETSGPSLVTIYRCKKCGAVLESETANCKKLHTPTVLLGERQIRNVTRPDYGVSGSGTSSDEARSTSTNNASVGSGAGSPVPQNNHLLVQLESGRQSHDYQQASYEQYQPYQNRNEERVGSSENNHGTDDVYLRRSITAGAVKTLKGLWKRQSQTEHEIVAPPPLPISVALPPTHSFAPVNDYQSSLARSNTFSHPTPPFNPAFNSPHPPHQYQQQQHHQPYPPYAPQGPGYSAPQQPSSQPPYAPSPW